MLTYEEALDYIYSFTDYEKGTSYRYAPEFFDLARMERLLALLDNPHRRFPSVHIAGTKGKGSTAAMTASVLQAAGYRTGLYTSPHLHTFRERIRVDGQLIERAEVLALAKRLRPLVEGIEGITTFEIMTAMAFLHFVERRVDFAVLEVGLGGRLDATNVVTPLVSVITSLSYDHTHVLGHTLAQIAREKAGIIKRGVPVVSAPQAPEAMAVIEQVCRERGAELLVVGRDWTWEAGETNLEGQWFKVASGKWQMANLRSQNPSRSFWIPLLGRHQLINATVVVAAVEVLRQRGVRISEDGLREGLRRVRWPGRLEVLGRRPFLVVDCAHNADSAQKLAAALRELFAYRDLILIFGASADKDIRGMMRALLPLAREVILTRAHHPRAADPGALWEEARSLGWEAAIGGDVADALSQALELADEDDLVCVTGSTFVVAEAREAWAELTGGAMPERD
ncbi:MAG TPA: bifunctional folylpolyglutamate synthase/dihydrofolate synthase [Anaerolineae bacterium]|nr:bifunctional folylpolyglutamate synthase/dihydrofolate synthase [Anaerolineae bacterium]